MPTAAEIAAAIARDSAEVDRLKFIAIMFIARRQGRSDFPAFDEIERPPKPPAS